MPDEQGQLMPGDEGYVQPDEYTQAKQEFGELYKKWNEIPIDDRDSDPIDDRDSDPNADLRNRMSELHQIILKYEPPVVPPAQQNPPDTESQNPQAAINNPETDHQTPPGDGLPPEDHPVTDADFEANPESGFDPSVMQEHAEQTVEKAGRPAGFNEFYAGSHIVNPDNELLYHLPSEQYEINKNKENR